MMKKVLFLVAISLGFVCTAQETKKKEYPNFDLCIIEYNNAPTSYRSEIRKKDGSVLYSYDDIIRLFDWGTTKKYLVSCDHKSIYGIIDYDGRVIISLAEEFSNIIDSFGSYFVERGDKQGYYNSKGKEIIPCSLGINSLVTSSSGNIKVIIGTKDDKKGCWTIEGQELIPITRGYTYLEQDFVYGFHVKKGESCGYCDIHGKEIISCDNGYSLVSYIKNSGVGFFVKKGDCFGFIDNNGFPVVSCDDGYTNIITQSPNGYLIGLLVEKEGSWGFVKPDGSVLIPTSRRYSKIEVVSNDGSLELFSINDGVLYCDADGHELSPEHIELKKQIAELNKRVAESKQRSETNNNKNSSLSEGIAYPFTLAYCIDGSSSVDIVHNEKMPQQSTIGFITFNRDYIVVDNQDTWNKTKTETDVQGRHYTVYSGPTKKIQGMDVYQQISVYDGFRNGTLGIGGSKSDRILVSNLYFMTLNEFDYLRSQYQSNMSINQFMSFSTTPNNDVVNQKSSYSGSSSSTRARVCPRCFNTRKCATCNGTGLFKVTGLGLSVKAIEDCPNCHKTGICQICKDWH